MPPFARLIACIAILIVFVLMYREERWPAFRRVSAGLVALSAIALFFASFFGVGPAFHYAIAVLLSVSQPLSSIVWLSWLVSRKKEGFLRTFALAALLNMALTAVLLALPVSMKTAFANALFLFSGLLMVTLEAPREAAAAARNLIAAAKDRKFLLFTVVRILIGMLNSLMIVVIVSIHETGSTFSLTQSALALVVVLLSAGGMALASSNRRHSPALFLPLFAFIPIVAVLPFASEGIAALSSALAVFYWFTAFYFSNIHLFRNMGLCGMPSIVLVSYAVAATSLGDIVVGFFPFEQVFGSLDLFARVAPMALLAYTISLLSLLLLNSTFASKAEAASQTEESAFDAIAEQYGFTPRESEVFRLLASGFSRRYISDKLVVSQATVKTHVGNIYQKIGINKHDSLLELVEQEKRRIR